MSGLPLTELTALSPVDGRYAGRTGPLRDHCSEYALIRYRVRVEIEWLLFLASRAEVPEAPEFKPVQQKLLKTLAENFSLEDAAQVKALEASVNHDVKAVEYWVKRQLEESGDPALAAVKELVHFACTSEDINNLAYALMLKEALGQVLLPEMQALLSKLVILANETAGLPMLARTHGQPASPTTLGKEVVNLAARLERQCRQLSEVKPLGKFNGAVGNYNAHLAAYPKADWHKLSQAFVGSLGLAWSPYTTQIEPHDALAEALHALSRFNTALMDWCRDIWGYIALGYFTQQPVAGEAGSSTMPHKVNPIDFENAEGNLGLANALLTHLAAKLPLSRWQRDLTDSTVLRSLGPALAHSLIAYQSAGKGMGRLKPNPQRMAEDLDANWEVLAEAVQTVMRKHGIPEPYEQLKALTQGQTLDQQGMAKAIKSLDLPKAVQEELLRLTPADYTGAAQALAQRYLAQ